MNIQSGIPSTLLQEKVDPMKRFFVSHQLNIAVGMEAVTSAMFEAKGLMDRLGIQSMYGCAIERGPEPEYAGDIDKTEHDLSALVEAARELRGICETIAQRL